MVDKCMLTEISHFTTVKKFPSGRDYQRSLIEIHTTIPNLWACIYKLWFRSCRGSTGSAGSWETGLRAHNCEIGQIFPPKWLEEKKNVYHNIQLLCL